MGCNTCKKRAISQNNKLNSLIDKKPEQKTKMNFGERMLNLFFRIFVFLFLIGILIPIIIPLTIAVIFNVIFNTHSFDITTGIKKIIKYLENKFDFSFKDRDEFDYDEDEDENYDENEYVINEKEVTIIKEEQDVK